METGHGLIITIENSLDYPWTTFACWYSLFKFLPDAHVFIQSNLISIDWAYKFKINISRKIEGQFLPSTSMIIREFVDFSISDVKEDKFTSFVEYSNGVGSFVFDGINTYKAPFFNATKKYKNKNLNQNEWKVLKMFDKMCGLYANLG